METELARTIRTSTCCTQYDTHCKKVLSSKTILAWILWRTVKEFHGMSREEIESCIEGTPEISSVKVNPGETNTEKITGMPNEDKEEGEGVIFYDIRFSAHAPGKNEYMKLIVNVEAQKEFYPGYAFETRGIFYDARMISAQLGTEFSIPDYDGIKKVYSIWILLNAPKKIGNAIAEYEMQKKDLIPGIPDRVQAYDKISVILVALNETCRTDDTFLRMLNTVFSPKKSFEEKKSELTGRFHMNLDKQLGEELNLMCNVSGYVENIGIEKGKKMGLREGLKEGQAGATRTITAALLRQGILSDSEIMAVVGLTEQELNVIRTEITQPI